MLCVTSLGRETRILEHMQNAVRYLKAQTQLIIESSPRCGLPLDIEPKLFNCNAVVTMVCNTCSTFCTFISLSFCFFSGEVPWVQRLP